MIRCTCSHCGSEDIRQIDEVTAVCPVTQFEIDPDTGHIRAADFGANDVDWNSQRTADEDYPFSCGACDVQLSYRPRADPGTNADGTGWLVVETIADPVPPGPVPADVALIRNALSGAEEFMQEFEDDSNHVPVVPDTLKDIRAAFGELSKLIDERDAAHPAPGPEFLGRDACLAAINGATETIVSLTRINTKQAAQLLALLHTAAART